MARATWRGSLRPMRLGAPFGIAGRDADPSARRTDSIGPWVRDFDAAIEKIPSIAGCDPSATRVGDPGYHGVELTDGLSRMLARGCDECKGIRGIGIEGQYLTRELLIENGPGSPKAAPIAVCHPVERARRITAQRA